jgi:hypothetical protein
MRVPILVLVALFLSISEGVAQESKVKVVVERARIYAESSTESYRIETVKKGTILTLFGNKQADENWFYVYYQSPRWKSKVTGFIQRRMVEPYSEAGEAEGKPVELPEDKPEVKPGKKAKTEPEPEAKLKEKQVVAEPPKKPEQEPKQPEIEEEPVRIERTLGLTAALPHIILPFPLSFPLGQNPRFYGVTTEEELESGVLPTGERRTVQPGDEVKTEAWKREVVTPERTEVTEKERDIQVADLPEKKEGANPLFTLSLGYGPSLGGIGGFIQLNASGSLSVHWGFGYYPTSMFYPDFDWVKGKALYSFGVKYYLPWKSEHVQPYVDLQYGGLSVEAVRVVTGIWYYTYIYDELQKTLWGPSLLAGVEMRFGSFGLNGAVGASYVVTKWEYWDQSLFLTADIGFLFYF